MADSQAAEAKLRGSGTSEWSGRFVRLWMLDGSVRLAAAGLPNGAFPLQRHEGGVHRLLAFLVVLLEEGVEVGGIRCSTQAALDKLVPSSRAPVAPSPIGVKDRRGQARPREEKVGRRWPAA
jgi:hypothetical protein